MAASEHSLPLARRTRLVLHPTSLFEPDATKTQKNFDFSKISAIPLRNSEHVIGWLLLLHREFTGRMSRPFELTYEPYTQRVTVIDRPESISRVVDDVRAQLNLISSALHKLHHNS